MTGWLILLVGFIYFVVSIQLALKGSWPLALVFFAYGISNIGLYMAQL